MKTFFIIIAVCILCIVGCATNTVSSVKVQPIIPPLPSKISLLSVEWQVVTVDKTNALFALDSKNYENLARNMAEITAYMEKMRYIIHSIEVTNITSVKTNSTFFYRLFH